MNPAIIIAPLLAAFAWIGVSAVGKVENVLTHLKPTIKGISILDASTLTNAKIRLIIGLFNPTEQSIEFQSFTGTVISNLQTLSDIQVTQSIMIKPLAETNLTLDLDINNLEAITAIVSQLLANTPPAAQIKGTITAGGFPIKIDETLTMKI